MLQQPIELAGEKGERFRSVAVREGSEMPGKSKERPSSRRVDVRAGGETAEPLRSAVHRFHS